MPPTVPELTARLEAAGVDVPAGARKAELEALVADLADGSRRVHVVGVRSVAGTWRDDDGTMRRCIDPGEVAEVPAWYAESLVSTGHARHATDDEAAAGNADDADDDTGTGEVTEPVVD